ncbi:MAG: M3 family metallopeptidase, partial [Planctomycetota bacterium]
MPQIIDRFVPADLDATAWANIEPLFETLRTREISSGAEFDVWLVDRSELDASCSEAGARLYINMTCDTGDEEAASAYRAFQTGVVPKIRPVSFELDKRQAELADRFGMRAGRFEVIDRDTRADVELFRQENVPILTELSGLSQEYQTVAGAMSVEFRGEVKTLPQMAVHQESTDRAEREEAWRATADRRLEDREKIDGLYDRMVERRDRLAKNAGEPSYVGYAFRSMHRFDYTPDDCRTFHQAIEEVVMPFCAGLDSRRRERLGVDGLRPWDLAVDPKGRPPLRPFTNGADLVKRSRAVFGALDPELAGLFERLGDGSGADGIRGGQLLDLDSRRGKAPGGYQYMQDRTRRPFIFMNAAGVHRDVETMVHEAGHAFHSMLCEDEPLLHYRHSPIEFAEVASMAMELLSMPHWGAGGG